MIQIENLNKQYISGKSSNTVLKDINLEIKEGEFIAIVGPSGSGKSTLLNMISGLDGPSAGSITVNKSKLASLSDDDLSRYRNHQIGFVFQEFHLESFLTVKENVLLPSYFNHHNKKDEKLAKKLIKDVGLETKTDSLANALSGGQKQRAAIARSLINKPQIIIADEPTGNLDAQTGDSIIKLLKKLHSHYKMTVIIATHDPRIAKIAKRIITIKGGKLC
jgi:putative ABC transport system ATP-binding protein